MTLESSSYEAKVSEALVQMLADSETFQDMVEAGSNSSAKSFIIEADGGEEALSVNDHAISMEGNFGVVGLGETERVDRAFQTWGYQGEANILLVFRAKNNDTPAEAMRRARNVTGKISDELQALVGASDSRFCYARFGIGEIMLADETGALKGAHLCHIPVFWRDIP